MKEASDLQFFSWKWPQRLASVTVPHGKERNTTGWQQEIPEEFFFPRRMFLGWNPEEGIPDGLWSEVEEREHVLPAHVVQLGRRINQK